MMAKGCGCLPHLKQLVDIIAHGLQDEQQKVRTITALALAALAEVQISTLGCLEARKAPNRRVFWWF